MAEQAHDCDNPGEKIEPCHSALGMSSLYTGTRFLWSSRLKDQKGKGKKKAFSLL